MYQTNIGFLYPWMVVYTFRRRLTDGGVPIMRVHFFSQTTSHRTDRFIWLFSMIAIGSVAGVWLSPQGISWFTDSLPVFCTPARRWTSVFVLLLPLLFSAAAVYVNRPVLLIPLAFWKAFFFCFVFSGFWRICGSTGWLVCGLAMFGSLCSLPVLCWYWLHHLEGQPFRPGSFLIASAALSVVLIMDFHVISPFLANILT